MILSEEAAVPAPTTPPTDTPVVIDTDERRATARAELVAILAQEVPSKIEKYKRSVSHTGTYLQASMVYAFERGLVTALELLVQGTELEKQIKQVMRRNGGGK